MRIAVNEQGRRIGQYHPRAKLTDREVELLLRMAEELDEHGRRRWGWRRLAAKFEIAGTSVKRILAGRNRQQTPAQWR